MKYITKKVIIILFIVLLFILPGFSNTKDELYIKAKLYIFDKKWEKALEVLDELIDKYSDDKFDRPFIFYKAKSLSGLNRLSDALESFELFIDKTSNKTLKEDAIIEVIEINSKLYKKEKNPKYLNKTMDYLKSRDKFIRYYAALELSYLKDEKISQKAVPVLKKMITGEENEELVNRAKLALMRINPKHLQGINKEVDIKNALLKITVYNKIRKKFTMEISFPFALVKMAFDSLPEDVSNEFNNQNIKLDSIMDIIMKKKEVFKFETEETIVKIWLK